MMQASAAEIRRLGEELSLVRKPGYDYRPFILGVSYLILYLALDWIAEILGSPSGLNHWHLTAGLSLGLLLIQGPRYAPVILLAGMVDNLWLHPLPDPFPFVALNTIGMTLIPLMAALIFRRMSSGPFICLRNGRDVVKFMATAAFVSITLAMVAAVNLVPGGLHVLSNLLSAFQCNLIGFATGTVCITPFLLVHARAWLDRILSGSPQEKPVPRTYLEALEVDRPATLSALSFLGMMGFVFWLLRSRAVSGELQVFLLFYVPLVWVAIKRGLEGLSLAVPVLMGTTLGGLLHLGLKADQPSLYLLLLLAASINAYMIGTGITQIRVTDRQMNRRDAILDAVSYAAQQFLNKSGWEGGIQDVMQRLGEATSVTRVFMTYKRMADTGGQAESTWLYEWTSPKISTDESDQRVLNLLRGQLIEEHANELSMGQPRLCRTKDIGRKQRDMLEALGLRSVVIVPMFVDRQWWGCLGLEQCFIERDWPDSEVDGLKMAGQILGTLIASVRVEQQFRQLTGNIQAVFWISSPDGRSKQYVSPGYEEVWGRSCVSLQRKPASWLEAIHETDQPRVYEALVKQVWGEYDEEYRVVRPDGSLRWVRDRAFPVRDQTGQVYRVVGIAEDITRQKKTEEQLRTATVMLSSLIDHLESGVVVEDESRRITHVNQAFNSMFGVPVPPQSLFGVDSRLLFLQPPQYAEQIEKIIRAGVPLLGEELPWKDRIFIRNYIPLSVGDDRHYHLWQYHDVTVSRRAEEQIKSSLKEKEVLLKEIHHRVKNNLQIICSLLSLQAGEIRGDPKACQTFKESQDRVKAMALIHERLYQSPDLAKIDFAGYVRSLTGNLMRSYKVSSSAIRLKLEVDSVPMNLDVAIPCGLIINELVSNALKYAFPDARGGEISVTFGEEDGQTLRLMVKDSGVGIPANANPENSESLGLKLVRSLTEQLGGTVSYKNQNGLECNIRIPRTKS